MPAPRPRRGAERAQAIHLVKGRDGVATNFATRTRLESQHRCCEDLEARVVARDAFILVSGESGSGRTAVCEQIASAFDTKLQSVFVSCKPDMSLQQARLLFLSQLSSDRQFDPDLNLADAINKAHFVPQGKIIIIIDDADSVPSSFYNELLALHEEHLGQGRFSFIVVCHPLWAEEKLARTISKVDLEQVQMPALTTNEAMVLSRHVFALHNTISIYNSLVNKLPEALAPARGNLSQIITITESLMKDPNSVQATASQAAAKSGKAAGKKKSSSVGIFVTVVCIIIVLACLIPIFFDSSEDKPSSAATAQVPNEEALVFADDTKSFDEAMAQDEGALPSNVPGGIDAQTPDKVTDHSVTLSGEELDKIEGGAPGSDYPRGMDRPVASNQQLPPGQGPQEQVFAPQGNPQPVAQLRRGDNVNHVAPSQSAHTEFDMPPMQQVQPAQQAQQQPPAQPQQAAAQPVAQGPKPDPNAAQLAAELERDRAQLEQAARAKLAADRAQAAQAEQAAAQKAEQERKTQSTASAQQPKPTQQAQLVRSEPQRPALKAGQVINLGDELRAQQAAQRQQSQANAPRPAARPQPVASGSAVEGSLEQLRAINGAHYTVQVVSASNRANIAAAAQGLPGRYWIVPSTRNGRPWYVLVYGDFATRQEAMNAAAQVPTSVSQGASPYARRISEVQAEMR